MAFSSKGLTHRSTVTSKRGMVASAHPLASLAGIQILMDGGNAIDSAIATAAALNVVEPYMSGIGGVGYMHIFSSGKKEQRVLDYIGLTPAAAELSLYSEESDQERGPLAPIVPGACAGWLEALAQYGTMDPGTVFSPAIEFAEQGYPLTVKNSAFFEPAVESLRKYSQTSARYLINGQVPRPGEIVIQPELARTFRMVAEFGSDVFYEGAIAEQIVAHMQSIGGLITAEDLSRFAPVWQDPVFVDYRGYKVCVPPPPCQAVQFLEILNIMEGFEVSELGHNTVETLHRFFEAAKLSIADRAEFTAIDQPPTYGLLSKEFSAERRSLIGERARPSGGNLFTARKMADEVLAGDPYAFLQTECTTHFDTIDSDGNAVACTQSLGSGFGSAIVVPGTGITLNNFMRWFDQEPTSPNAIGPSKKIEMCVSPVQIWDDGGLRLLIGTPGSYGILQTTPQMIMNVIDHDMNIQAAIEAARAKTERGFKISAEDRIGDEVFAQLERRGHRIDRLGDWSPGVGGGQGIMIDPDSGTFMGGADPRRDGYAIGW